MRCFTYIMFRQYRNYAFDGPLSFRLTSLSLCVTVRREPDRVYNESAFSLLPAQNVTCAKKKKNRSREFGAYADGSTAAASGHLSRPSVFRLTRGGYFSRLRIDGYTKLRTRRTFLYIYRTAIYILLVYQIVYIAFPNQSEKMK